jgi:hypothetical protein
VLWSGLAVVADHEAREIVLDDEQPPALGADAELEPDVEVRQALGVEHLQVGLGVLDDPRGARRPCREHDVGQELEMNRVGDLAGADDGPGGDANRSRGGWTSENTTSAVAALAPGSRYPSMAASAITFWRWVAVTSRDSRAWLSR